ncbi:unnamed protein product, partial [Prorocentrum cordatum]
MLRAARSRLGPERCAEVAQFIHADVRDIPLPSGCVDAVLSCAVLHHLPGAESRDALGEFARVLRPGGRLLASAWDPRARAVAKRGRPVGGGDPHAYWVAWRCDDGGDVDRWYHLPPLPERRELWRDVPGLVPASEPCLDRDNQVFEWTRALQARESRAAAAPLRGEGR